MDRPPRPLRLALDTNVVLDLMVFNDSGVAALANALAAGHVVCFTSEACLEELRAVLARPQFLLDTAARESGLAQYRRYATLVQAAVGQRDPTLPRCTDPDDQKFLELARDAGVDFLVTKDKALLKLRRARVGLRGFRIVTPKELGQLLSAAV